MPEIDPRTRAQIDRLRAVDVAKPRLSRALVEDALRRHLAALDLPLRPILWAMEAEDGYDMAEEAEDEMARTMAGQLIAESQSRAGTDAGPILRTALEAATYVFSACCKYTTGVDELFSEWKAARTRVGFDTGVSRILWQLATIATVPFEVGHAIKAARAAALDAARATALESAIDTAKRDAVNAASDAVRYVAWQHVLSRAELHVSGNPSVTPCFSEDCTSDVVFGAWNACQALAGLAVFDHPAMHRLVDIWSPLVDAFEAGLLLYWIAPTKIICVPAPAIFTAQGRLHREDGPAVEWPSEKYYVWKGMEVPADYIERRAEITIHKIKNERNAERRRVLCDLYGRDRFIKDIGAIDVHRDRFGILWRADDGGDEPLMFVEVENSTIENGARRKFYLRVPPTMKTAHEAVAWTFRRTAETYLPEVQT